MPVASATWRSYRQRSSRTNQELASELCKPMTVLQVAKFLQATFRPFSLRFCPSRKMHRTTAAFLGAFEHLFGEVAWIQSTLRGRACCDCCDCGCLGLITLVLVGVCVCCSICIQPQGFDVANEATCFQSFEGEVNGTA
jgi:hypothetical protein